MSELKARTARSIADAEEILELGADCPIEQAQVYLKYEADREIARQKRKRCLATAHFCWERRWRPEFDKYAFWHRWGKIWFELADKLKEA